ncbi:MAG: ABC transporter substrate-binding protein [Eubacteriales bacterium]
MAKKLLALVMCLTLVLSIAACGPSGDDTETETKTETESETEAGTGTQEEAKDPEDWEGEITFWHFNTDEGPVIAEAFMDVYPNVKVEASITSDDNLAYPTKVQNALRNNSLPDVVAAESASAKRFVNMEGLYTDLEQFDGADAVADDMVPYVVEIGTDDDGVLRALSHQAAAGAIAYKRPMAEEYFGTDDPEVIYEKLSPENMIDTAEELKEASDGEAYLWASVEELFKIYSGSRDQAWVEDGKFTIDPKMVEFLEIAKELRDGEHDGGLTQWESPWTNSIRDDIHFAYAVPTWGVSWIIDTNESDDVKVMETEGTGGRWGLVNPINWFEGGTWFGVTEQSENKELAWEFLRFITANEDYLNELAESDFVSKLSIIEEKMADDDFINPVVDQNIYKVYGESVEEINGDLFTSYDDSAKENFLDAMNSYLSGNYDSVSETIGAFEDIMEADFGAELEFD